MRVRRGLISVAAPTVAVQSVAVDDFNELPARKRDAVRQAARLGHQLGSWHRRPNDSAGRWNAHCDRCGLIAVVAIDPPPGVAHVYGHALTTHCQLTAARDADAGNRSCPGFGGCPRPRR